jgi:branched-chain amino acid transport system permease protein
VYDPTVALMVLLGGAGTLAGPIIGALLLEPLQQYLTVQFGAVAEGLDLVVYGFIFLAVIYLLPEGIVPTLRRTWSMWRAVLVARSAAKTPSTSGKEPSSILAEKGES